MKITTLILTGLLLITMSYTSFSQVGINTTTPDASAALQIESSSGGLLPPRMTYDQMNAIVSPAEGLMVYCSNCYPKGMYFYDGEEFLSGITGSALIPLTVTSLTGEVWIDRNLGASQVAASSVDVASYGDLYQWGRAADGHQVRTSGGTATRATTAQPNMGNIWDGLFIFGSADEWLISFDDSLWHDGTNNPCPENYRIPTQAEWSQEIGTWSSQNDQGAFNSPLKLPLPGHRSTVSETARFQRVGNRGYYWSSTTIVAGFAFSLEISSSNANTFFSLPINGYSVRCIKD